VGQPEQEIDTSRWSGPEDHRKVPPPGFGIGEAAALFGMLLLLFGAKGVIFDGMWLGPVVMIMVGLAFILFGLRRRSAR
jgi:hypothetical protein